LQYLRTNSDLCHLQHKLIGFYNRDEKCLQRGTDWVFKQSSLSFAFKGLINGTVKCRGADKSLARLGRKQARKHVEDERDVNNIETRAFKSLPPPPPLRGKAPKKIHAILKETLAFFLPGRAKDLSVPLYNRMQECRKIQ